MALTAQLLPLEYDPLIAPTVEVWRAMSPAQREQFLIDANDALQREIELSPPEGVPHSRERSGAMDMLGGYYRRIGRRIYLGSDLAVHYPGRRIFAPDLLAVLDVPESDDDDDREAWVVADEGKGLDFVLEVLNNGSRKKDLADNVVFYASLGITEYFVYDRRKDRVIGHRLPAPGSRTYVAILPRLGRISSTVLGLELGVVEGHLRFFHGEAELPSSRELLARINALMARTEARAEAEQARAEAEQARAEAEQARAEAEQARAEAEQARAEAEQARAEQAMTGLRSALLTVLRLRGLNLDPQQRRQVDTAESPELLGGWLARAETATSTEEILQ